MITLTQLHADHGSIVLFEGIDVDGGEVLVAADHGAAQDIYNALVAGEEVLVDPPLWAVSRLVR